MKAIEQSLKRILGEELPKAVAEQLAINKLTIDSDFSEQPTRYAWWAIQAEKARSAEESTKMDMDVKRAELDRVVRDDLEARGFKVTEKLVESEIFKHPELAEARVTYLDAIERRRVLDAIVQAFKQRGEMLISLGAHMRAEMDTDLRINASKARASMGKDA